MVIAVLATLLGLLLPSLAGARAAARSGVCQSNARQLQIALDLYARDFSDSYAPGMPERLANLRRWHGARATTSQPFSPHGGAGEGVGGSLSQYLDRADAASGASVRSCPQFVPTMRLLRDAAASGAGAGAGGFELSAGGYGYNNAFVGTRLKQTAPHVFTLQTDLAGSMASAFGTPHATIAFADAALADGSPAAGGIVEYSFAEPRFWPDAPGSRADPSIHFRHAVGRDARVQSRGRANVAYLDGHVTTEVRTKVWSSGVYDADPDALGLGWFGSGDDNALFDFE